MSFSKYLVLIVVAQLLFSCTTKDETFYLDENRNVNVIFNVHPAIADSIANSYLICIFKDSSNYKHRIPDYTATTSKFIKYKDLRNGLWILIKKWNKIIKLESTLIYYCDKELPPGTKHTIISLPSEIRLTEQPVYCRFTQFYYDKLGVKNEWDSFLDDSLSGPGADIYISVPGYYRSEIPIKNDVLFLPGLSFNLDTLIILPFNTTVTFNLYDFDNNCTADDLILSYKLLIKIPDSFSNNFGYEVNVGEFHVLYY
jgi:hypothetical protein